VIDLPRVALVVLAVLAVIALVHWW